MPDPHTAPKDVADLLEHLARRLRTDPAYVQAEAKTEPGGITVWSGEEEAANAPSLGAVDIFRDGDAITVTAETRNTEASQVHVTLAEDRLFIGLGDGARIVRKDLALPHVVDETNAVATFRNGILDIVLPIRKRPA